MRTLIVILNYRTANLTVDCLRSLQPEIERSDDRVVVVDGASRDGSVERIAAAVKEHSWGDWASLLPLDQNRGYAAANNAAIRPALASADPPKYVLILNPDTITRPGAVTALVNFMEGHPRAGIAGSRLEDPDGTPQISAFRFPSIWSEWESGVRVGVISRLLSQRRVSIMPQNSHHRADWVTGASLMIRTEVLRRVGLLDERYFLYYEEQDYCLQVHRAGWECWHVPESRVVHLIGQSTGVSQVTTRPSRRPRYWFDSRRRYFLKNFGWLYAVAIDVAWASGFAIWRLLRLLRRQPDTDPPLLLWDFLRYSSFLRPRLEGAQ